MSEEKRVGVVSSERNARWLEDVLSDRLTSAARDGGSLGEILGYYQATNVRTIVVDDDVIYGNPEAEETLATWAKGHAHPRVRVILFVASERPTDDPYLYRLVSDAEVHDILIAEENGEPEARLLQLLDEPMAPMEYGRWRTNDPGVWQGTRPGLFESLFGSPKKQEKKKGKKKTKKGKYPKRKGAKAKDLVTEEHAPTRPHDATAGHEPPQDGEPEAVPLERMTPPVNDGNTNEADEGPRPATEEPGDVASVYGIDIDDLGRDEEDAEDMGNTEESRRDQGDRKRVDLDLGAGGTTRKMPVAETHERDVAPKTKGVPKKEEKPAGKHDAGKPEAPRAHKSENVSAPVEDGPAQVPSVAEEAVTLQAAVPVVEDVRARTAADPAPGTVTLTFPGSSLGSILESFVRPGAERRQGVSFPSAESVVAVSALRPGMGCTHVSVALGTALAGQNVATAVALRTRFNLLRMLDGLDDSYEVNGVGVRWHGCDFYFWEDQRRFASEYEVVVADCGVIDTADNSRNSPTNLFVHHAKASIMLIGGSPWDLPLLDGVFSKFEARNVREWRFGCCRTTQRMLENFETSFGEIFGDGRKRMWPVPYSPSLFDSPVPRFENYREVLEPALPKNIRYPKRPKDADVHDAPASEEVEPGARPGAGEAEAATVEAPEPTEETRPQAESTADTKPETVAGSPAGQEGGEGDTPKKQKRSRNRSRGERRRAKEGSVE